MELLVVVAILAILMAVLVVVLDPVGRLEKARISNASSVVSRLGGAVEACYAVEIGKPTPGGYQNCDQLGELEPDFIKSSFEAPEDISYHRSDPTNRWYQDMLISSNSNAEFCIIFWDGLRAYWHVYSSRKGQAGLATDLGGWAATCSGLGGWRYVNDT